MSLATNSAAAADDDDEPRPPADEFSTVIDNPFFTLRPGTTFVYRNVEENAENTFVVTRDTVVVDGVECVVVHDTARINGQIVEDTFDYFAQDEEGNVWYFGEDTHEFEPGNPVPISNAGAWLAGVNGAEAGIYIQDDAEIGDVYMQENAPGIAEDTVEVLSLDAHVDVIYGSFDDALLTLDYTPLQPGVEENKFYVEGVGNVLTTNLDGEREQLVKVLVDGLAGADNLLGYAGGDEIRGRGGNDQLRGLEGSDLLDGGTGNDKLIGKEGGDTLRGGAGDDWLAGGHGADTFSFATLNNGTVETDTILNYRKSQVDVIDLPGGLASIVGEAFTGGAWHLTLAGDGDVIVLAGAIDAAGNGTILDDLLIA